MLESCLTASAPVAGQVVPSFIAPRLVYSRDCVIYIIQNADDIEGPLGQRRLRKQGI